MVHSQKHCRFAPVTLHRILIILSVIPLNKWTESFSLSSACSFEKITSTQFRNNLSCGIQERAYGIALMAFFGGELFTRIAEGGKHKSDESRSRKGSRSSCVDNRQSGTLKGCVGAFYGGHKYYGPSSGSALVKVQVEFAAGICSSDRSSRVG